MIWFYPSLSTLVYFCWYQWLSLTWQYLFMYLVVETFQKICNCRSSRLIKDLRHTYLALRTIVCCRPGWPPGWGASVRAPWRRPPTSASTATSTLTGSTKWRSVIRRVSTSWSRRTGREMAPVLPRWVLPCKKQCTTFMQTCDFRFIAIFWHDMRCTLFF